MGCHLILSIFIFRLIYSLSRTTVLYCHLPGRRVSLAKGEGAIERPLPHTSCIASLPSPPRPLLETANSGFGLEMPGRVIRAFPSPFLASLSISAPKIHP